MGVGILLRHPHFVLVNDSVYDTVRLWLFVGLIAVGLVLITANVARDRRKKHRAGPVLRAVVEQVTTGDEALRQQITDLKAELDAERTARTALSNGLSRAFGAAGMPVPADLADPRPELHVLKGGGAA